jgi:hypothetical protein
MKKASVVLALGSLLIACSDGSDHGFDQGPTNPYDGFVSETYSDVGNWLCHPSLTDADNVCAGNLDSTRVFADGSTELETHVREPDPKVDCFYVYPTTSADPGLNSDLEEGPEEMDATLNQAARYSRFCRVFAPVYRQESTRGLFTDDGGHEARLATAYADVLDSFKHYIANDNQGRGFILIGHSQGSDLLKRLIAQTVEADEYLLQHMISAHLLGHPVRTAQGSDLGDFQQVPVCRTPDQTGCIVNYSTYRVNDPDLTAGLAVFGTPLDGASAICTNPAALSGGSATLNAYFPVAVDPDIAALFIKRADGPYADPESAPPITTPFYTMPDFISGECVVDGNGISYLKVTVHADPTDPRADDFNGEIIIGPGWGLHFVDMTLPLGDLVDLGAAQSRAWLQDQ